MWNLLFQSVILGPSDELGLHVFQGVTSTTQSEDEDPFDESEGAVAVNALAAENEEATPTEPARLAVNLEAWNNFLEQSYPQHSSEAEHHDDDISDTPLQLKDSGIARPSFSTSVDVLGKKKAKPFLRFMMIQIENFCRKYVRKRRQR